MRLFIMFYFWHWFTITCNFHNIRIVVGISWICYMKLEMTKYKNNTSDTLLVNYVNLCTILYILSFFLYFLFVNFITIVLALKPLDCQIKLDLVIFQSNSIDRLKIQECSNFLLFRTHVFLYHHLIFLKLGAS